MGGEGKTLEADVTYVGRKPWTKVGSGDRAHEPGFLAGRARRQCPFLPYAECASEHRFARFWTSHASPKSHFMTDEGNVFTGIGWNFASHGTVTHSKDEYVRYEGGKAIHTNTVEGFFSILKRGIYGVYQHVSEAHLHRYLTEFDFRYNSPRKTRRE